MVLPFFSLPRFFGFSSSVVFLEAFEQQEFPIVEIVDQKFIK